jgi:CshA-type fibril repeat protein/VCBS repeat-containing protein
MTNRFGCNVGVLPSQGDLGGDAGGYVEDKPKKPMFRTLEPRMVFDAAADVTAQQALAPVHPEPFGEAGHPSAAEPAWSHLAEALKAAPVTPVDKPTDAESPAAIKPVVDTAIGDAKAGDVLLKVPAPETVINGDNGSESTDSNVAKDAGQTMTALSSAEAHGAVERLAEKAVGLLDANAGNGVERLSNVPGVSGHLPQGGTVDAMSSLSTAIDAPPATDPTSIEPHAEDVSGALVVVSAKGLQHQAAASSITEPAPEAEPARVHDGPTGKGDQHPSAIEASSDRLEAKPGRHADAPAGDHMPSAADRVVVDPRASDTKGVDMTVAAATTKAAPKEVFFVWDNVQDWQQIVANLGSSTQVYVLDASKDGVTQIAAILKDETNITAIHLISHGTEGSLSLGTAVLDAASMQDRYLGDLTAIGEALSNDGDILIYGCDFAAGTDGLQAAVILGGITRADIAASIDATGAAALGGDWDLERRTGAIETDVYADYGYQYLLANPAIDLDGATIGTNFTSTYAEQGAAVAIVATGATGATITDADSNLQSITIVASAAPNGNSEHLNFNGTAVGLGSNSTTTVVVGATTYSIVYTASTRTFIITNDVGGLIPSGGDTNTLVRSITYDNSSDNPTNGGTSTNRIFTFTATDTTPGTAAARTATVTISAANDAPVDVDETNTVIEDTTLTVADGATGDLLNNATDGDSDPLTITAFTIAGQSAPFVIGTPKVIAGVGTLTINANGSYAFTPVANFIGTIPVVTYTVSDGAGGSDTSTLTLTMASANDAPAGADNTVTVIEDDTYTFLAGNFGFTDPNDTPANTLQAVIITTLPPAAEGTLLLSGNPVTAGETIPVAQIGNLTFQPAADVTGSGIGSFTFQVVDNGGTANGGQDTDQSPNTFSFDVTAVNDPPVDGDDSNTVTEDTTLTVADGATGDLLNNATDADGDPLTITAFTIAGQSAPFVIGTPKVIAGVGTLTINANGSYSFAPAANFTGTIPVVTYTVSDGAGGTDTSTLTLTMAAVNDAPVDGDETNNVAEDTTLTVAAATGLLANASDIDGNPLTIAAYTIAGITGTQPVGSAVAIPGVGVITINADGSYSFAPAANYVGTIPIITYTVSDGAGGTDTSTLTLTMVLANDAPAGTDSAVTITEDTAYTFSAASFGFTDPNDTPANGLQAVIITTLPPAAAGTLLLSGVPVTGGQTIPVAQIGDLTFQPAADVTGNGIGSFTFQLVDNGGTANGGQDTDQSPNTFSFNITAVNDPPVATDDTATTPEETPLTVSAASGLLSNDTDVDGNPLTITQFGALGFTATAGQTGNISGVGSLTINTDGSFTFVPVANFTGTVPVITYTVSDGNGGTDTATFIITVTPVNDPPVDGNDTNTVTEDTTLNVAAGSGLLANTSDLDGGTPSVSAFTVAGETGPFVVGAGYLIAGVGTITINADGSYSFAPVPDYDGAVPVITYTVSDGAGGTDTSTLTLTMVPVNDAPIGFDDAATTPENAPVSGNVLGNDTDVDDTNLSVTTFEIDGETYGAGTTAPIPGVGSLLINADGSFTFTPAAGYDGPVPDATYTVSDGDLTDTAVLTLTITPLNDPPVADDEAATTPEDTTLNVPAASGLLVGDTDIDGDPLTITQFQVGGNTYAAGDTATIAGVGALTINPDGSYIFAPAADYNGTVPPVTYTVSDGLLTDTGTLTIEVTPVNDPPATVDDTGTTPEDTPLSGNALANDTDVDGDTLTLVGFSIAGIPGTFFAGANATIPGVGTITIGTDGSYTLVPAANYTGPVPDITYTVTDGNGGTRTGTLTLFVTPVNDPPVAVDDTAETLEDTPLSGNVLANDSDVDGDTLVIDGFVVNGQTYAPGDTANIPGVGDFTLNADGSYTFVPAPGYTDPVPDVTYTVSDGNGETDNGVLSIDIIPINNGIGALDDVATTPEETQLDGNVVSNDRDPDGGTVIVVSFTLAGDIVVFPAGSTASMPGIGDLTINANGTYTFVPALNYFGPVPVATYIATDGVDTDTATLTITVTPVNDLPDAVDDTETTTEDTPVGGSVLLNDTDVEPGSLTVTQFVISNVTFTAGQTAIIPSIGRLTINADGTYTFTPFADYNGPVPVATYTVADADGGIASATLTIVVTPVNDAPVAVDDTATTAEDTPLMVLAPGLLSNDTDVDGTPPQTITEFTVGGVTGSFTAGSTASIPGVGDLTINADGSYFFVSAANFNGLVPPVSYTASDGTLTDDATLTITVTPINDQPVAVNDTGTLQEDTTLTVSAASGLLSNDTDVEGGPLSVIGFRVGGISYGAGTTATIAGVGVLTIRADGGYTFTPVANYNGTVPLVTYQVTDGNATDSALLTIIVTPVNDAPVAVDDTATTAEDTTLNGAVLGNDIDIDVGDVLSVSQFSVAGDPTVYTAGETATIAGVGALTLNSDGSYTFVPALNYSGSVPTVTYTADDGNDGTDTATLTIKITPVNDPPDAVNDAATTDEDTTLSVPASSGLLSNDVDVDGDTLRILNFSVAGVSGGFIAGATATLAGVGTLTIRADGSYTFVPVANYNGPGPVATYTVTDDHGGTDTAVLTITVAPVNDPPVDGNETNIVTEDTTLTVLAGSGLLVNTTDIDGGTPSVSAFSVTGQAGPFVVGTGYLISGVGTITIRSDGSYSFAPAINYAGTIPVITYTVSDGAGGTDTSTLTLTIVPVNDPPVDGDEVNSVTEDTILTIPVATGLLANTTDVDGGTPSVSAFTVTGEAGPFVIGTGYLISGVGTITINANGSYSFSPAVNYAGIIPVINYTVSDGAGGTDTSTLSLTMIAVNDPPVATDDSGTTSEDTTLNGNVLTNDTDVDGGALSVTQFVVGATTYTAGQIATITGVGTLVINANGTYTFVPVTNYNGPGPVATYTVSDGNSGTDTAVLTITVTPVNDPPVDGDESNAVTEDTTLTVPVASGLLANTTDVDGGTPRISAFTVAGQSGPFVVGSGYLISGVGTITISANGSYSFAPAVDYVGAIPVMTYTVSDGAGGNDISTLTLTMVPVDDPPVDADETNSVTEDTTLTVLAGSGLLANTTDVDGGAPSVSAFTVAGQAGPFVIGSGYLIAGVGTITVNANGSYSFAPAANYAGTIPVINYTVSDGAGGTDTSTLTLAMIPVNDPPIATDDTATTPEDTTLEGNVLANDTDTDIDGGALSVTQFVIGTTTYAAGQTATINGVGTVTIGADGDATFVPAANFNGPVPIVTYTVSDGNGGTDTATITITVTPVNDPPVDADETNMVTEDTTLTVPAASGLLVNTTDIDGGTLSVSGFTVGSEAGPFVVGTGYLIAGVGRITIRADGSYTFVPAANYTGAIPVITYTVSDGAGGEDTSTLTLTMVPVNDPPVDGDEANDVTEDTTLDVLAGSGLLANTSDIDGGTASVISFTVAGEAGPFAIGTGYLITGVGTITIRADGSYAFVPAANYTGAIPVITYKVSDGAGGEDTSTLTLTMAAVNDPPVASDDAGTTQEDTTLNGEVLINDTDIDGGLLRVTQFVVGGTTYMSGQTAMIAGIGVLTINANGSFTFVPSENYNGPVPIATYTVSDSRGGTDTATLTLTVTPVNDAPDPDGGGGNGDGTGADIPDQTSVDATVVAPLDVSGYFFDVDGDVLTYAVSGLPAGLSINPVTGVISGSLPNDASQGGPYIVVVTATDPSGLSATQTFTWNVANPPPIASDDVARGTEDTALTGSVLANDRDPDGDALSVTQFMVGGTPYNVGQTATLAGIGTLAINADGSYIFIPAPDYNGPVPAATYTLSDSDGGTDTGVLTLTIAPVEDLPDIVDDQASGDEDTTITGNVLDNDSDPDGDPLMVTSFTVDGSSTVYLAGETAPIPFVGVLSLEPNGDFTFIPSPNYNGQVPDVTYTASDGNGGTGQARLQIIVNPVDDFVPTPDDKDPDLPDDPDTPYDPDPVDGAVVDAVRGLEGLNDIADLTSQPIGATIHNIDTPIRFVFHSFLGGSSTIVIDKAEGGGEKIHVEAIKHTGILYLQVIEATGDDGEPSALGYRLRAVDTFSTPNWLRQIGPLTFAGHPDAKAGIVDLILSIVQRDGRVTDHKLQLDTASGQLSHAPAVERHGSEGRLAPTFSEQMKEGLGNQNIDRLERALGFKDGYRNAR